MITPLYGYPTKFGQKIAQVVNWVPGETYDTGGLSITATSMGMGGIEDVIGGVSVDGLYSAEGRPVASEQAGQTYKVMLFVVATGLEVANGFDVSAVEFRLFILGV